MAHQSMGGRHGPSFGNVLTWIAILVVIGCLALFGGARAGIEPAANIIYGIAGEEHSPSAQRYRELAASMRSAQGVLYVTDERIVNISDPHAKHYLRIRLALEFTNSPVDDSDTSAQAYAKKEERLRQELGNRSAIIYDEMVRLLSNKTSQELLSSDGRDNVKQELRTRLAQILDNRKLLDIYLLDFLIG